MKIVIAPDSFKGSLSALEVAQAIAIGIRRHMPEAEICSVPMADGGEGTVEALVDATQGSFMQTRVTGPLFEPVTATWGVLGDGQTAVIEMAVASGLPLVPVDKRNPLHTTTFGTGELILAALDAGCRKFIIGIGGSATTDAGAGMAQALGARFFDQSGVELPVMTGGRLSEIARIDITRLDARIAQSDFQVACDVTNPLYGHNGAAYIFGPQKGASAEDVQRLDKGLQDFAACLSACMRRNISQLPGTGAAGGLGAGLMAFCNADLSSGVEIVMAAVNLSEHIEGADLVITGEGCIDAQTPMGKTASGVAKLARRVAVPVIALGGTVSSPLPQEVANLFTACFSIQPGPGSLEEAIQPQVAQRRLSETAQQVTKLFLAGRQES